MTTATQTTTLTPIRLTESGAAAAAATATIPYCCVCDGLLTPEGAGCVCAPGYAAITGAPVVRECKPEDICEYCRRYRARGYVFSPSPDRLIQRCKRCFERARYEEAKRWGELPDYGALECDVFGNPVSVDAPDDAVSGDFDADGDLDAEDWGYRRTPLDRLLDDEEIDFYEGAVGPDWASLEMRYGDRYGNGE